MIRYVISLILICGFTTSVYGQANEVDPQKAVIGLFDALSALDVAKAKSFCTADVTFLENGKIWNFDSLALRITSRKANSLDFKRINKIDFIKTKVAGRIAWIIYHNQAKITFSGETTIVKWLESVVVTKDSGEWKISLLHSTELERKN